MRETGWSRSGDTATLTLSERFNPKRFFRGEKAVIGPITLTHRRVFILPNRRGLGIALMLTIMLLAAINYNNNLAYILAFLLASVSVVGILHGFGNLAGLKLKAGHADSVFAGDSVCFELVLDNPTDTNRYAIQVHCLERWIDTLTVEADASTPIKLDVPTERRGWLAVPTVTLSSTFPLGLFRAWAPVNLKLQALIYPRPAPAGLPFPAAASEQEGGRRSQSSDEFHGFQNYQPGDPLHQIHWRGVAKGQGVHVRQFAGGEIRECLFDWQHTPGIDVEERLGWLCRWIIDAEQAGMRYGLRLPGQSFPLDQGQAHRNACLRALALFGATP